MLRQSGFRLYRSYITYDDDDDVGKEGEESRGMPGTARETRRPG